MSLCVQLQPTSADFLSVDECGTTLIKPNSSNSLRCVQCAPGTHPSTILCTSTASRLPTNAFTWLSKPPCSSATLPPWSWCSARGSLSTSTTNRLMQEGPDLTRGGRPTAEVGFKVMEWVLITNAVLICFPAEFHSESQAKNVPKEHTLFLWCDLRHRFQHTKGTTLTLHHVILPLVSHRLLSGYVTNNKCGV